MAGRPCLLSPSKNPERKTPYTVEAISLNRPDDPVKSWIGINQNAANRYVEHYLRNGGLPGGRAQHQLRGSEAHLSVCVSKGVETWQANFSLNKDGVRPKRHFKIDIDLTN